MQFASTDAYRQKIRRILISEEEIRSAVQKAGADISREYEGKPLLLVSILKGSYVFLADLSRAVTIYRKK